MLEAFRMRMFFFLGVVTLVIFVIVVQIINLQLIRGDEYREKSRMNMENYVPIPAARGEIYDRNFNPNAKSVVIVSNRPSFNVTMVPSNFKKKDEYRTVMRRLCKLLALPYDETVEGIAKLNPWERVTIKEDVDFNSIVTLATHQDKFPFIDWEASTVRVYNFGNMFAHAVGYTGSISREEFKKLRNFGYRHYQKVGKAGLESEHDILLRGSDGYIRRIVDVRKRTDVEEVGLHPVSGSNMVLTIDYEIQRIAHEAMEAHPKGSVIVMKAASGEVLSLLSKPDYDPNLIISKDNVTTIKDLMEDKERPFLNRAIMSKYPPASTFKLMTAIAALESERWDPATQLYCPGKYTLKGYVDKDFFCYDVHGTNNMEWAICKSCSVYFYQVGLRTTPTRILEYAGYFGLGEKTGINLPGEIPGFIPSGKWKQKTFGQTWYDGDTVNLSIGQGFISATPIGMAAFVSGIVNNGIIFKPNLVREVRSQDNRRVVQTFRPVKMREIPLSQRTLAVVKNGMRMVVASGTASRLSGLKVPVAGKTGTAQTRSKRMEDTSQHAWFVGYAPFDAPPEQAIVVVVMVEYGVAGAATAVPVAERIFGKLLSQGYFNAEKK